MIDWRDRALVLTRRPHGETSAIVDLFTRDHGRQAGLLRGGISRKKTAWLQPGTEVDAHWKARLEGQLGTWTLEPLRSRGAALANRLTLDGLAAVTALLAHALAEGDPHPAFYDATAALLDLTDTPDLWPIAYLAWELTLLEDMGFGLDLSRCAVTGQAQDLIYVSPRTGRAISAAAAGDWAPRLLPLPPALRGVGHQRGPDIAQALGTTGWFLEHRLLPQLSNRTMPAARARLIDTLARLD